MNLSVLYVVLFLQSKAHPQAIFKSSRPNSLLTDSSIVHLLNASVMECLMLELVLLSSVAEREFETNFEIKVQQSCHFEVC